MIHLSSSVVNLINALPTIKIVKYGPTQVSFCSFLFFSNTNFTGKTEDFSGIQTRIVGVEGEHADHLTTTTARPPLLLKMTNFYFEEGPLFIFS